MLKPVPAETMPRVTSSQTPERSDAERGAALQARMEAQGLNKVQLAKLAGRISRGTLDKVFAGTASGPKMQAVEDALAYHEENPGDVPEGIQQATELGEGLIEFEISLGAADVKVVVRGSKEDADILEERALHALRALRADGMD